MLPNRLFISSRIVRKDPMKLLDIVAELSLIVFKKFSNIFVN
jgi:hypothetical protein